MAWVPIHESGVPHSFYAYFPDTVTIVGSVVTGAGLPGTPCSWRMRLPEAGEQDLTQIRITSLGYIADSAWSEPAQFEYRPDPNNSSYIYNDGEWGLDEMFVPSPIEIAISGDSPVIFSPCSGGEGGDPIETFSFLVEIWVDGELVANDDSAVTEGNTPVNVPVLANDTLDDEPVALEDLVGPPTVVREPWVGEATVESDGTITYVPPAGFCGTVSFDYEIETAEPERCVRLRADNGGLLLYDGDPPGWWGEAPDVWIETPSGSYSGAWDWSQEAYVGGWPASCTDEEGTVSWADGSVDPLCVSWSCSE